MEFNVKAFAILGALIGGGGLFAVTLWMIILNGPTGEKTLIGMILPGYTVSIVGCFIGAAWAGAGGLVGGGIFAVFYNLLNRIFPRE